MYGYTSTQCLSYEQMWHVLTKQLTLQRTIKEFTCHAEDKTERIQQLVPSFFFFSFFIGYFTYLHFKYYTPPQFPVHNPLFPPASCFYMHMKCCDQSHLFPLL